MMLFRLEPLFAAEVAEARRSYTVLGKGAMLVYLHPGSLGLPTMLLTPAACQNVSLMKERMVKRVTAEYTFLYVA